MSDAETMADSPKKKGKWTRRAFIGAGVVAGGALVIGVAVRPGNPTDDLSPLLASGAGEQLLNAWVKIGTDNVVTAIIPHVEMGQGAFTALAQMLADEMDADWTKVEVLESPAIDQYVSDSIGREFIAPNLEVPGDFGTHCCGRLSGTRANHGLTDHRRQLFGSGHRSARDAHGRRGGTGNAGCSRGQ